MPSKTCTDYWLDVETMSFIGDFEGMYTGVQDPWGCDAEVVGLSNKLFLELICHRRQYRSILDIGCGLGGFTNLLRYRNEGCAIIGADVAPTAVLKARVAYPEIGFKVLNVLTDTIEGKYDLIVLSEVLWYLLDDLPGVFNKLSDALEQGGCLGIKQYFPFVQKFGVDKLNGLDGLLKFVRESTSLRVTEQVVRHNPPDGLVLMTLLQ